MIFDVPKVIRSPGSDHGIDEESRNGRDINIDTLDDYVWTLEGFRVKFGHIPECRGVTETHRSTGLPGQATHPSPSGPNWTRKGGAAPPSFLLPLPLPFPLLLQLGKEGGSRTPPWRALPWPAASSPLVLCIRGQGGTSRHNI